MDKGNSQEVYCIIKNFSKLENKIAPQTEKNIVIKAIKRQPGSILGHRQNFTLLTKEDKTKIAQTFVECDNVHVLASYLSEGALNIDEESKKIFNEVITSYENSLNLILDGYGTQDYESDIGPKGSRGGKEDMSEIGNSGSESYTGGMRDDDL